MCLCGTPTPWRRFCTTIVGPSRRIHRALLHDTLRMAYARHHSFGVTHQSSDSSSTCARSATVQPQGHCQASAVAFAPVAPPGCAQRIRQQWRWSQRQHHVPKLSHKPQARRWKLDRYTASTTQGLGTGRLVQTHGANLRQQCRSQPGVLASSSRVRGRFTQRGSQKGRASKARQWPGRQDGGSHALRCC